MVAITNCPIENKVESNINLVFFASAILLRPKHNSRLQCPSSRLQPYALSTKMLQNYLNAKNTLAWKISQQSRTNDKIGHQ